MADNSVRVGRRLVSPGDRRRRIRVELHRLVLDRVGVFDLSLLPQDEVDELLRQAGENVSREIANEEAAVIGELGVTDTPIDPATVSAHVRAESLLTRLGVDRPSEKQYALALHAARYGVTVTADPALESRLEGAEALSDLAKFRLNERGLRESDADFEREYLAELRNLERESGLSYYDHA